MAVALAAVCLALLSACNSPGPSQSAAQRDDDAGFAIDYRRSGGLQPTFSSLRIRPGRHAVATAEHPRIGRRTVRFRVSQARIQSLRRGLRRARFGRLETADSAACPDCYAYEIERRGHRVALSEPDMPPRLRPLVSQLETVITTHAIPPEA